MQRSILKKIQSLGCCFIFLFMISEGQLVKNDSSAIQIAAGIGIDGFSSKSVFSYANAYYGLPGGQQFNGFESAVEFFIIPEYTITDKLLVGIDYSYLQISKSVAGFYSGDFTETIHRPMMIAHYFLHGEGYWFRAGGGIGYELGSLKSTITDITSVPTYHAQGYSIKIDAVMNLAFDDHLYGMLGTEVHSCFGTSYSSSGVNAAYQSTTAKLTYLSLGLKIGMMYEF